MIHPIIPYVVASVLCGLAVAGLVVRRDAVRTLLAVELLLNAVTVVLVTADTTVRVSVPRTGQSFALFVIVLGAAQLLVGLALVRQLRSASRQSTVESSEIAP